MDITALKEDGIYLGEHYRIPFKCSVPTEYSVTNNAYVEHSDVLDEAVTTDASYSFEIKFYESANFATEKTDDFMIGEMLYFEIDATETMLDQIDWAVKTCTLSHDTLSYAFYENVSKPIILLKDKPTFRDVARVSYHLSILTGG